MSKLYVYAGIAASVVMIASASARSRSALSGRSEVQDKIKDENIDRHAGHEPGGHTRRCRGRPASKPTSRTARSPRNRSTMVTSAKCFAEYMRIHAFEDTGGMTYAEMPRFIGKDGEPTAEESEAAMDPEVGRAGRVTRSETSGSPERPSGTALNTSYFAEQVAGVLDHDGHLPCCSQGSGSWS